MSRTNSTETQTDAKDTANAGRMVALSLALTSVGFLVLEGIVCQFSQRTDPWHGYLWFATVVVLGTGVMAMLLRSKTRRSKEQLLHALLVVALTVHLFAACLYLWIILFDAGGTSELFQSLTVLIPALLLVVIFLVTMDVKSLRVLHGFRGVVREPASVEVSPDTWHSVTISLSFTLVMVLAFAWSCSSSFSFYYGERFGGFGFSTLPSSEFLQRIRWYAVGCCVQATMIRLCSLSIVHAFMVNLCHIRSPRIRAGAIVCGFALAAWGYAFPLTLLIRDPSAGVFAIALVLPPIAPFAYALVLSNRVRTRLSDWRGLFMGVQA